MTSVAPTGTRRNVTATRLAFFATIDSVHCHVSVDAALVTRWLNQRRPISLDDARARALESARMMLRVRDANAGDLWSVRIGATIECRLHGRGAPPSNTPARSSRDVIALTLLP